MVTKGNHSNDFVICPEDGLYERWFRPTNRRFQLRLGTEEVLVAMASSITYDICKFNPPPSSEFVCAVCHCVLHEPRMCVCRHIFCKVCIETWLNRSSTCPSCRSHATLRQLQVAPPLVVNVLNGLTMDCEYKEKGCDITISMEKFPSHVTSCEYRVATCSHKDCNVETTVRELPKHKKECPYRMEQCHKDCRLQFPFYKLEGHDCFRALRDTVDELNNTVRRYQVVLSWVRKKMNLFHMPHQSAGVQLQGYQDMMEDVNRFWPPDQHIPLNLCGDYVVPSAAAASGSFRGSGRGDGAEVLRGASQLGSSILERLVAEASTPEQERRVFSARYPDEADGPSARVRREHPARGVALEMSTPPLHSSSHRAMERLGSPSFQFLDQSLAALTPLPTPHRPLPFSSTAPPPRSSRSPNRPAPSAEPQARPHGSGLASSPASPEPFRSDNSGVRSYPSPGSSIDFSSYSDEERYSPLSPRMPLHLRSVRSTDYLPVDNHPYTDALYPALRYSRLARRSDLAPHNARPRNQSRSRSRSGSRFRGRSYRARTSRSRSYSRSRSRSFSRSRSRSYSRSRSRSYSPARLYSPRRSYTPARSFSSARSYSPSGRFSPSGSYSQSRSYSRSRSHSHSRSRSNDGGNNSRSQFRRGRYSQSPPLSQSRSSSTSRRSVRARSRSRSWEHRQTRSCSQSYDSSNTSNMNSDRLLSQAGEEDQMDEWTPDSMNAYNSANASSDDHSSEGHHSQLSGPESQSVASEDFRDGVYQSPGSSSGGRENSNCTSSAAGGFPFPEAAQRRTSEDLSDGDYWIPPYRQGSHHSAADRNRSLAGSEDWSTPSNENHGREGSYSQQGADRHSSHAALVQEDGNGGVTSSSPDSECSQSNARLPSSPVAVSSSPVVVSSSPDRSPAHEGSAAADHAQPSPSSSTQRGGDADGVKRVLPQPLSHSYAKQGSSVAVSEREMNSKERGTSGSSTAQQTDNGGTAGDGKRGKIQDQEASRNVWESSSDATSLDYDLPESPALSPQPGLSTEQRDNGTASAGLGGVSVSPEEVGAGRNFERVASSTQDLGHGVKDESESGVQNGDKIDDQRQFSFQPLDSDHDSPSKGRKGKVAGSSKGKGKALLKSKTNLLSESESYSDSICYKRKSKAKSLPMSSNDEGSSDEEVNQAVQRKVVHEDSANSNSNPAAVANLPSTSSTSLKLTLKIKQEEETKAKNKKKIKKEGHKLNPNQTNSQKHETESKKRKAGRSKQHKSTKKARLNGPPAKDGHRSVTHLHNTTHPMRHSNPQPKKHTHAATVTAAHSTSLPQLQSSATTSQRAESETWVNQAQVEIRQLENESMDRVSTATNSRVQGSGGTATRGSRRSANEGNRSRGYDGRNVGADATVDRTSRTETSRGRVSPVQGRGLRVMMIENLAARPAARRRPRGQGGNLRMVRIPDLPVPPTTLDLLNQYDDSDESDCTWSPSSSDDSDFRQR